MRLYSHLRGAAKLEQEWGLEYGGGAMLEKELGPRIQRFFLVKLCPPTYPWEEGDPARIQ